MALIKIAGVLLLSIGCLVLQVSTYKEMLGGMICGDKQHYTAGRGISCCEKKYIKPGIISENMKGHVEATDDNENLTMSTWRVYSNMLATYLPDDHKTITLSKFAEIMGKHYPEKLRKDISETIEKLKTSEGKDKSWLEAEVQLSDYENLNRIRVIYFNIQKHTCGKKPHEHETVGIDFWGHCSELLEVGHRDGGCCRNITLPIHVHDHHDSYVQFKPHTCNTTMAPLIKRMNSTEKEDVEDMIHECNFACFLVEKKHISLDSLLHLKETSKINTDKIVDIMAPLYLSKSMIKHMKDYMHVHVNLTYVLDIIPHTILGEKGKPEDLLPCYAYQSVSHILHNSLHEYCYPDELHEAF